MSPGTNAATQGRGLIDSRDSAAGGRVRPASGHSISPAEALRFAVQAGPLSAEERTAHRCAVARVRAQDEAARAEPSPQLELAA